MIPTGNYDLSWRRRHVAPAILLLLAATACLAWQAAARPLWLGQDLPVNDARVKEVTQRINPNTATVASLRRMGGIGPVKAQAIFDYAAARSGHAFNRGEDLDAVPGIGPATVQRLKPFLKFTDQAD
jgi:competence ComEA-like helix-hairpin-helix protein